MEKNILNNIDHLYRHALITTAIIIVLSILAILVAVGIIKFKLIASQTGRIVTVSLVVLGMVLLLVARFITIQPIYMDYKDNSYIVLENAEVTIREGTSFTSGIEYTNQVTVISSGNYYELKMQTDYSLSTEKTYTGTVAYLKHSKYIVWYDLD